MSQRPFYAIAGDLVARTLLVVIGLLCVPVPSVLLYLVSADQASAYASDDAAFLWAFVVLVASALIYGIVIAPMIWRRRFFLS